MWKPWAPPTGMVEMQNVEATWERSQEGPQTCKQLPHDLELSRLSIHPGEIKYMSMKKIVQIS